jgi:hypothetical protein
LPLLVDNITCSTRGYQCKEHLVPMIIRTGTKYGTYFKLERCGYMIIDQHGYSAKYPRQCGENNNTWSTRGYHMVKRHMVITFSTHCSKCR